MIITTSTTEAQILAPIQTAKDALLALVTKAATDDRLAGEALVRAAQDVRNAEAVASAQHRFWSLLQDGVNAEASAEAIDEESKKFLFRLAVRSDDSWSGRGNDSVRSTQDAVRDWAESQFTGRSFF